MRRRTPPTSAALAAALLIGLISFAQDALPPPPPPAAKPLPAPVRDAGRAYEGAKRKADEEYAARLKPLQQGYAQKVALAHKPYDRAIDEALRAATRAGHLDLANQLKALRQSAAEQAALDAAEGAGAGGREFLSDLEHHDVVVFGNWFGKAGAINGGWKIAVDGRYSPKGISLVPPVNGFSSVKFQLGGRYKLFAAHVAINDTVERSLTPVVFEVWADGRNLWKSAPVQESKTPQECRVDLRGAAVLELRVNCPGPNADAHAVWLEPRALR